MKIYFVSIFIFLSLITFSQQSKIDSLSSSILKTVKKDTNKVLVLRDSSEQIYISSKYLKYFADTIGKLTIQEVCSENFSFHFKTFLLDSAKNLKETPEKSKVFWLRLTLKNEAYRTNGWYLSENGTGTGFAADTINLFFPNSSGTYFAKNTGSGFHLKNKDVKDGVFNLLNLPINKEGEITIFIRFKYNTSDTFYPSIHLEKKDSFWDEQRISRYVNGIFFGIMFAMIIINLILFFSVKDRSYLYYVSYLFCLCCLIISISGFGKEFIYPNLSATFGEFVTAIGLLAAPFFYALFGNKFLQVKKYLPKWNKAINIYIVIVSLSSCCLIGLGIFQTASGNDLSDSAVFTLFAQISLLSSLASFIIVLIPAILCVRKGYKPAKYFLYANLALVCGILFAFLELFYFDMWISQNLLFIGFQAGTVGEAFIFSFGLNFRIKLLEREKQEAQEKALVFLEQKVKERTAEVVHQKKIIEEKNKDITDSITYAKRIQQAKLPKYEEIKSTFSQSFVLFKPKDIVSGDFYYFTTNHQSIFIASADCTGHGVPGAFMSMIGSEKLDDAVSQSADTSEILRQLNKGIKNSLHQSDSDESTRDGMDIALCSVDINNRIVKYAGANRPLWIIRKGQTVVEEIKGTKTAIGGLTEDSQHFDSHEIKLQQDDTFYIFSDGYADTFGGKEEKKLTTKKFKEILLSIQDKSMADQEAHLDSFIEDWKAGTEQVDDILVIGVRL